MITIIEPHYYWPETTLKMLPLFMEHIERCGRICYKSEDLITNDSAAKFVEKICRNRHESVLEHCTATAIVVCSRACSHQLVRHRIAAYSQESQRYCDYGKKSSLQVICPESIGISPGDYDARYVDNCGLVVQRGGQEDYQRFLTPKQQHWLWEVDCAYSEYKAEVAEGIAAGDARYVLPNATKTEIAVTFNLRQWRHVFQERALNKHAQWEIRGIFSAILADLKERLPAVFCDLEGN
ncbi:MAG: FAD-dependent thymidylate synthase [Planctomycetota bacterium]|jgi:thymidylate synthase (FAD)